MAYKDPERERACQAEYRKDHVESRRTGRREHWLNVEKPKLHLQKRLEVLRALLHVAQRRYNQDPCADFRRDRDGLQNAVDELVAGPELERLRSTPHPDPLLSSHAPEVPPAPVEDEDEPIWEWAKKRYWTHGRRRLYRRAT